ncbi:PTS mannitol transporter subunit IICB [Alteribacillus bidgolensis]|uniref:PTS system mannitol-specific EIICB component n=1 Tax=Alteribacillus bidgolensis TaxID=930129 RepID=A0A1G8RY25_9BACI|nr:PTS mannitol transporter subunit IICB [Alteribacillus bidgolensis]SDJ21868.1 PTS system, mannitol-specific IIC component [Alteribacillus bidgolensis]
MMKLGQLLSAMVYRNIAVILTAGIINGIFGIYGWWYNDRILLLLNPIYNILLPILLGYTGGRLIGGQRGAVVASIVTYGLTLSSSTPFIIGAMIVGPLTGWVVKQLDQVVKKRMTGIGYELLIGNALAAIISTVLTILCFLYVGQSFSTVVEWLTKLLETIIYSGWLPLTAAIIEPAKILFFNNIINFGVLGPLGIQQTKELGKSIFFLLEANPGPGLGVLLAYWLKMKAEQRKGAKLAVFIHFFGGIHEVCFPYVLMKPVLIIALILGGMVGVFTFQLFDIGLVAIPSPASIFLFVGLAPKEDIIFILLGIFLSAITTFFCSMLLLKRVSGSPALQENREYINFYRTGNDEKQITKDVTEKKEIADTENVSAFTNINEVKHILFVCEAGMGSSAMGASMLKKKLAQANLTTIEVENSSVSEIPEYADLIICHQRFLPVIQKTVPNKACFPLKSFTDMKGYDEIVERIKNSV